MDNKAKDSDGLCINGATDEDVLAAAKAANCDDFVNKLPQGYATPIGENGAKLSGGERQRISRSSVKHSSIVRRNLMVSPPFHGNTIPYMGKIQTVFPAPNGCAVKLNL